MSLSDVVPSGPLLGPAERSFLSRVSRLVVTNPFEPGWDQLLGDALGSELVHGLGGSSLLVGGPLGTGKDGLSEPLAQVVAAVASRLRAGVVPTAEEIEA